MFDSRMHTSVFKQISSSALSVTSLTKPTKNINKDTDVQNTTETPLLEFTKMRKQASEIIRNYISTTAAELQLYLCNLAR